MLPKGLIIAIVVGIIAGGLVGLFSTKFDDTGELEFIDGSSISIITEKNDFELGESITIKIINSGTTPLTFSDASYGLKIMSLTGRILYSPISAQVISELDPGDEIIFSWNQIKNDGNPVLEGLYKISVNGADKDGNIVERSTTVTIWK